MLTTLRKLSYSFLLLLGSVLFLVGCSTNSNNDEVIKAMEENLEKSNISINTSTTTIMKSLDDKSTDWNTKERAEIWYANAKKIVTASSYIYSYIDDIKHREKLDDSTVNEINSKLIEYKASILNIDSSIWYQFKNDFDFSNATLSLLVIDTSIEKKLKAKKISDTELSASLNLLQNYIKITENKTIAFCHSKVGTTGWTHSWVSAMVGQNSTYVKIGEEIEIMAGIGSYSIASSPIIHIGGKKILVGDAGFAKYVTKAPKSPGKYKIPVQIEFTNPATGKQETQALNVEYTVAKPCN